MSLRLSLSPISCTLDGRGPDPSKDMHASLTLNKNQDTSSLWLGLAYKGNDMRIVAWSYYGKNGLVHRGNHNCVWTLMATYTVIEAPWC